MATLRKEEGRALQLAKDALAAAIREDWFRRVDGDQRVTDADGVPRPEVAWAGRMLAARAAGDEDAWRALLTSVPDAEFGRHVGALLEMCALVTASAKKGGA